MNWLSLLESMEEFYHWKRDNHPPYPDLRLEWGLYHHLRGLLALEAGDAAAAAWIAEGDATLAALSEEGSVFDDFRAWEQWASAQRSDSSPAPKADTLRDTLRRGEPRGGMCDQLIDKLEPLDGQPAPILRAAGCVAFRRLFVSMTEFHAPRAGVDVVASLQNWAVLTGGNLAKHWLYAARYEKQHGNPDRVEAELAMGLAAYPDEIEILRELAVEKDRQGLLPDAIKLMERAVELQPAWPDLRVDLAELLERGEHPESSLMHLGKALELNPAYEEAALSRAELLVELGDWEEAESKLLDLRENRGESQAIYSLLSRIYAEKKDSERADHFGLLARGSEQN